MPYRLAVQQGGNHTDRTGGGWPYNCTFNAMIKDWRQQWSNNTDGRTSSTFPFGYVQLNGVGDPAKEPPYTNKVQNNPKDGPYRRRSTRAAPRGALHEGRSTGGAPRGPLHGEVADLFYTDVRSILMVLWCILKVRGKQALQWNNGTRYAS